LLFISHLFQVVISVCLVLSSLVFLFYADSILFDKEGNWDPPAGRSKFTLNGLAIFFLAAACVFYEFFFLWTIRGELRRDKRVEIRKSSVQMPQLASIHTTSVAADDQQPKNGYPWEKSTVV
jgi:hypothetical protein